MQPQSTRAPEPEQAPESAGVEIPSVPAERVANPPAQTPSPAPSQAPTPAAPQPAIAKQPPAASKTNTPATADDVDVIEKDWVDAAQEMVAKNSEDPHGEEEGFEDLQVDYLKKRYGKDIKKPSE